MRGRGAYIVFEGIDGSGTTTHSRLLVNLLRGLGYCVSWVQEPSRGPIGSLIRSLLRDTLGDQRLMALLFAADRLEQVLRSVGPLLEKGCIVVSDRSWVSSLVYQSYDDMPGAASYDWVYTVNLYAPWIDVLVFIDVSPEVAFARIARQRAVLDEVEKLRYLTGLARRYRSIINSVPRVGVTVRERVYSERPIDNVARSISAKVIAALYYMESDGRLSLQRQRSVSGDRIG